MIAKAGSIRKNTIESIQNSRAFFSFIGLVFVLILSGLLSENFFTLSNVITIARQASVLLIMSVGMTTIILTTGIDLSAGAIAGFVGCSCAQLMKMGVPVPVVIIIGLLIGGAIGVANGTFVGILKLPPFVATYGVMWAVNGLSIIVMSGAVVYGLPAGFSWIGTGYIGIIPVPVIIAAIIVGIFYILLQKTTLGRDIYTIGSNREAAMFSAIPITNRLITVYTIGGVTAAIVGLILTARLNAAEASMGEAFGLQAVAAVVIGGTSLLGGEGGVIGTVMGALILTVVVNIMNLIGISSFAQPMVVGAVIILTVLFDSYTRKRRDQHAK